MRFFQQWKLAKQMCTFMTFQNTLMSLNKGLEEERACILRSYGVTLVALYKVHKSARRNMCSFSRLFTPVAAVCQSHNGSILKSNLAQEEGASINSRIRQI